MASSATSLASIVPMNSLPPSIATPRLLVPQQNGHDRPELVLVVPVFLARRRVDRVDVIERRRQEHDAVDDDRRGLHRLQHRGLEDERGRQLADVVGVDLGGRGNSGSVRSCRSSAASSSGPWRRCRGPPATRSGSSSSPWPSSSRRPTLPARSRDIRTPSQALHTPKPAILNGLRIRSLPGLFWIQVSGRRRERSGQEFGPLRRGLVYSTFPQVAATNRSIVRRINYPA